MTLQASGDIDALDLIAEFGGTGMITEYYRGAGLVPSTRVTEGSWSYGTPTSEQYSGLAPKYSWNNSTGEILWLGAQITATQGIITGTYTKDGYEYERLNVQGGGLYSLRRRTATYTEGSTVNINTGVPTSGDIDITDFYSATAS